MSAIPSPGPATVDPNSWLSQQGALPLNAETMACAQD